jgi:hypothetical protein
MVGETLLSPHSGSPRFAENDKRDGQLSLASGAIKSLFSAILEPIIDPYSNSVVAEEKFNLNALHFFSI